MIGELLQVRAFVYDAAGQAYATRTAHPFLMGYGAEAGDAGWIAAIDLPDVSSHAEAPSLAAFGPHDVDPTSRRITRRA